MTRKIRIVLLSICVLLFLAVAPAVVFYSQGYRIDFEKKKFTQTGAFYFKILPKGAQIHLSPLDSKNLLGKEQKIRKKTDFFFGTAFIDNLLPRRYEIEVKKEGFLSWKKVLEIREKQVIDAKNIVLAPENPSFEILAKKTDDFFFSPDEKKIILKSINEEGWSLEVWDPEKNSSEPLVESKEISEEGVGFSDLKFSPDSKKVLLKVDLKKGSQYLLYEIASATAPSMKIPLDFIGNDAENIAFNPGYSDQLFISKKGTLYQGNLSKEELSLPLLSNVISFEIFNKDIYYLNNSGFLFKTDFTFIPEEKINKTALSLKKDSQYRIYVFPGKILLAENGGLFSFNPDSGAFERFSESTKELKISPNSKKIVYFSNYEIWIFFLEPELSQPRKLAGEKLFIARFSEKIEQVFWYTSHYLIFNSGDKIKIAEIDDRDRINIIDLKIFADPKIFWAKTNKELYILSNGDLYKSEKLIR